MPRGRIGLFGTKKSKESLVEAEDFIAQLFEQEPDFPETPVKTRQKSTKSTTKTTTKSTAKTSKTSKAKTSKPKAVKKPKSSKSKKPAKSSSSLGLIRNYDELIAALGSHYPQVTLADNIIAADNILINYDVTIDFNGFSIISDESHQISRVLDIRRGVVELVGKGKVFAMGKQGVAIRVFGAISNNSINYTNVTVGQEISLFAPDSYGLLISPNFGVAYGLTVNFAGQIFAHDGIGLAGAIRANDRNLPNINIQETANIVADETTGVALEAAGFGQWGITGARLSGAAAASLTAGNLNFTNPQAIAKDITFSLYPSDALDLKISLDGGTYVAERGANIAGEKTATTKISIKSGNFYSPDQYIAKNLKSLIRSKGKAKFSKDVAKILVEIAPEPEILTQDLQPVQSALIVEPTPQEQETIISEADTTSNIEPETQIIEPNEQPADILPADVMSEKSEAESPRPAVEESPTPPKDLTTEPEATPQPQSKPQSQPIHPPSIPIITPSPIATSYSAPTLPPIPSPAPVLNEQEAARMALADAINDIRKLNSADYGNNFQMLEQIVHRAELILSDPRTTVQDIFTTAGELLQAFDKLQQGDDFLLSDDELDELFYHGAVLEEMVSEPQDEFANAVFGLTHPQNVTTSRGPAKKQSNTTSSNSSPTAVANQLSLQVQSYDTSAPVATDFGKMIELLNLIADLDLNRYLATSQTILLESLAEAEEILNDPTCSQEEIDDITERMTDGLQALELVRLAHLTGRSRPNQPKITIPAPVVHQPIPIIMIDEMAPSFNWSTGATMIDELTPYIVDADTLEKMIRATKPVVTACFDTIVSPFRKISRSLAAGAKAGLAVYRETLHAAKN